MDVYLVVGGVSWFIGELGCVGVSYSCFQSNYGIFEEDEDVKIDMYVNWV